MFFSPVFILLQRTQKDVIIASTSALFRVNSAKQYGRGRLLQAAILTIHLHVY